MQGTAQGLLVWDLTHSQLYLGLVAAASTIPVMLLALPGGVIADRLSKRRIVLTTQSCAAVLALGMAALVYSGEVQPWHILIFAALNGCVNAMDVPARQTMLVELVGKDDLINAMALNSSAFNSARIVGPAIAGLIVAAGGTALCFLINGISYVAVIVALVFVRSTQFRTATEYKPVLAEIIEGLRYAKSSILIRDLLIMTAIMSVFALQYSSQLPAFARGVLGIGDKQYGLLVAAAGVGSLLGGILLASLGHVIKQRTLATVGSFVTPAGIILLSLTRSFPVSVACLALVGCGGMLYMITNNSMLQMASPDRLRGRIISLRTFMFMGLTSVGALALGAAAQFFGVQPALRYGAAVCAVAALYFAVRPSRDSDQAGLPPAPS
jgi:MFS family permease